MKIFSRAAQRHADATASVRVDETVNGHVACLCDSLMRSFMAVMGGTWSHFARPVSKLLEAGRLH
jgi:hypothetical protein